MKRKILSLVLSLAMLVSLAVPALAAEATFPDVQGHWGESSVERWAGVGVLNGTDTGSFNPDANMTRAEFAQMMVNLMGYTGKSGSFSDVPSDAWYAGAINALAAAGVGSIIITPNEPVAGSFNTSIMICFCIVPIIGHVATVIAMHFYKLDHKKMEEVQQQLAERKAMNVKEA